MMTNCPRTTATWSALTRKVENETHRRSATHGGCWRACAGGGTPGRILPPGNEPSQRPTLPSSALQPAHLSFRPSFQLQLESGRRRRRRRLPRSGRSSRGARSSSAWKCNRPPSPRAAIAKIVREVRDPLSRSSSPSSSSSSRPLAFYAHPTCRRSTSSLHRTTHDRRQAHPILAGNITSSMRPLLLGNHNCDAASPARHSTSLILVRWRRLVL